MKNLAQKVGLSLASFAAGAVLMWAGGRYMESPQKQTVKELIEEQHISGFVSSNGFYDAPIERIKRGSVLTSRRVYDMAEEIAGERLATVIVEKMDYNGDKVVTPREAENYRERNE